MAGRTRLDQDERRAQILAAARKLYSERHYADVSTTDVADAAGVTRGLVHHYFGRKRDLYVEVVRSMLRPPVEVIPGRRPDEDLRSVLAEGVEQWLTNVERNRHTWLAAVGAQGFGRDPEIEEALEQAREQIADRVISLVLAEGPGAATPAMRAVVRAYGALAEAVAHEWLEQRRLTRDQARELLLHSLLRLVEDVLPRLEQRPAA
jgi:AcrR family transcriptional regulator